MNIYDIAQLAGVSIATVSRVVNDSPRVSEKTKNKVRAIMDENGYTPNVFARGLGLDSMKTIGIMCPDVSDAYMATAVAHLESRMHEHGYDCILCCTGYEQSVKEKYVSLLLAKRIDALIMVGSVYAGSGDSDSLIQYVRDAAKTVPVFLINGYLDNENVYCAYGDDYKATFDVTSQMIERGRKRILFLCDSHSYSATQKLEGYEAALKSHGLPVLGDLKLYVKNRIHSVRDILLERRDLNFDSVVATDDGLAVGAIKYANSKLLKIPEDLCITGFNNSALSICSDPELSSVDNKVEELCNLTISNMMKILHGNGEEVPRDSKIPCKLIKRCTTDF
ncbi:LacI family DNA-binding transcriptional regulator [Lacrimispora aerotolerans]|jgi:LacI family transcriptional regulator/LacI family asc operon transcriptional repressor|uniref:LacI family DNA-binding transcriptional regulator n=1 Tax=Lacrimispora aerotolerans TaxID=36832 RepID=UPI00047D66D0|nr:LacI family DNA-binding transcriptional regulator [Lacrimispora aerotolerans]